MKYVTPNATKKTGPIDGELSIETFKNTAYEMNDAKARRRKEEMIASPAEVLRYGYDQNGARSDNDRPGIPCTDYNGTVQGGD